MHGGLQFFMSQAIADISSREAAAKHMDCTGMSKAMGRAEMRQAFRGEATGEILLADSVYAVSGKFFSPLIDEQPLTIQRFWGAAVSADVAAQQLSGFRPKLDLSIPVSLAEQDQDPLLGLEVLDVQGGDLRGPGTGIIKQA